jgi:hypothetical protein
VPRNELEALWARRSRSRLVRINTGSYLNQRMSLVAQLWGIAASVAEIQDLEASGLRQLGACVREGVPTNDALIWLRALGGLDRVLATKIGQYMALDEGPYTLPTPSSNSLDNTLLAHPERRVGPEEHDRIAVHRQRPDDPGGVAIRTRRRTVLTC